VAILLTGSAGFIGSHVALTLLARGERVVGVDNMNAYYDVRLKEARLERLTPHPGFQFHRADVADREAMNRIVDATKDLTGIIHLAAQAGVRYSLENPFAYIEANVMGQTVMLEAARRAPRLENAATRSCRSASTIQSISRSRSMPRRSAHAS
jgi:UDP-glucuronate 4-epimerase